MRSHKAALCDTTLQYPTLIQHTIHPNTSCGLLLLQVRTSDKNPLLTCLLEGPAGTGKTALAATVGLDSQFPFVKLITAETMVGFSEAAKTNQIAKVFDDAYRVSLLFCCVHVCTYVSFSDFASLCIF